MKVLNSVSLNMLAEGASGFRITSKLDVIEQDIGYANGLDMVHWNHIDSYIGHQDLCDVIAHRYGVKLACNRASASLEKGEKVLVIQYLGQRLPEGSKELPEGSTINFLIVEVL